MILATGKCSCFGGPQDLGMSFDEGLSCIEPDDLDNPVFGRLFLPWQPQCTTGLARRLNPYARYIAMRWAYGAVNGLQGNILPGWDREAIRRATFVVSCNGRTVQAQAADWGPDWGTGRVVDCSQGVLDAIGATTDDAVTVTLTANPNV